jgi:hypothetical protein
MIAWSEFAAVSPDLAEFGRRRLEGRIAYLATVRVDGSPRLHPVSPFIVTGHLFVYMEPASPKSHDLRRDGRFALHCAVEDNSGGGGEFLIRGSGEVVIDQEARRLAFEGAAAAGYKPDNRYVVFELKISAAMSTVYEGDKPKRVRWNPAELEASSRDSSLAG